MSDITLGALYQYCLNDGCEWTSIWYGGSAADDPAMEHLKTNPNHTVRSGAKHYHAVCCARQSHGEDITAEKSDEVKADIVREKNE